jgi:Protein of unknown function (DUF2934)
MPAYPPIEEPIMSTRHHRRTHHDRPVVPNVPEAPPANLPIPPVVVPDEQMVRARAYQLWEQAGRPASDGAEFWLQAEREFGRGR